MPDNSIEYVVGTPIDTEVVHSTRVVQLKNDQGNTRLIQGISLFTLLMKKTDPDLYTYLQQKQKEKVMLIDKDGKV